MVQILSQWSGAGSVTVYALDLFKLLGVTGNEESLLVTAVFGLVKFAAASICALFLVDVIGRKRSLLIGITFQSVSILYIAAFTAVPELGVEDNFILPNSDKGASKGAIAMIYQPGVGWALGWNSMQYLITAELSSPYSRIDNFMGYGTALCQSIREFQGIAKYASAVQLWWPLTKGHILVSRLNYGH